MWIYKEFYSDESSEADNDSKFQNDINSLKCWSQERDLKFNAAKCSILHVGIGNQKCSYELNNAVIQDKSTEKYLEILFPNNKLKFNAHIGFVILEVNNNRSIRSIIPLYMYKSLVRPHLGYNFVVQGHHLQKETKKN